MRCFPRLGRLFPHSGVFFGLIFSYNRFFLHLLVSIWCGFPSRFDVNFFLFPSLSFDRISEHILRPHKKISPCENKAIKCHFSLILNWFWILEKSKSLGFGNLNLYDKHFFRMPKPEILFECLYECFNFMLSHCCDDNTSFTTSTFFNCHYNKKHSIVSCFCI